MLSVTPQILAKQKKKKKDTEYKASVQALRSDAHGKSAGQNLPFSEPWADIFRMRWRISLGFVMMGIKIRKTKGPNTHLVFLCHVNTPDIIKTRQPDTCQHVDQSLGLNFILFLKQLKS